MDVQQHLGATVLYCWKCFFEPISLPKVRRVSWPEKAWVFYIICISYFPLHLRHSIAFIYLTWLAPPWLAVYGQSWPSDLGIFDIVEQPASRSERFELRQFNVFKIVQITILWSLFLTTAKWLSGPLLCSVIQSCQTLCDPTNYSPPGSSVHGISQTRILEWVSISFSRGLSPNRGIKHTSPALAGGFFTTSDGFWAIWEAQDYWYKTKNITYKVPKHILMSSH